MITTEELRGAGKRGGASPKHKWTEEERAFVRVNYRHTHASRIELGKLLSVTEYAVAGQIAGMGIAKRTDRRPWTPDEDEQLADLIMRYSPRGVAIRMHRSLNSVVVRAKRLGFSRRARNDWFTKREVCELLGVDHKWVGTRIDRGILPAGPHNPDSFPRKGGSACWEIPSKDLRKFIIDNRQDLNGRNVDLITLVPLLVGEL